MSRRLFGTWGLSLNQDDFAQAIAAYGALDALRGGSWWKNETKESWVQLLQDKIDEIQSKEKTRNQVILPWALFNDIEKYASYHREMPNLARDLAYVWEKIRKAENKVRLDVKWTHEIRNIVPWVLETLSSNTVYAASVFSSFKDDDVITRWSWPLEVAFLDDPDSDLLSQEFKKRYWPHLTRLEMITRDNESCTLLILPWSLKESVARVLSSSRVSAHFIVVLGGMSDDWTRSESLKAALLTETDAAGIWIIDQPKEERLIWFNLFIEQLSHNQPLDIALLESSYNFNEGLRPSYLFVSHQLLLKSKLENVAQRVADEMDVLDDIDGIVLDERTKSTLRLERHVGMTPFELGDQLRKNLDSYSFDSESQEASGLAELIDGTRDTLKNAEIKKRDPRWLQAQVFEENEAEEKSLVQEKFIPNSSYTLEVFVGPIDKEVASLIAPEVFPDELLPPESTEHTLTVVFSEPFHAPTPQVDTILLPKSGKSTTCSFYFHTLAEQTNFEARIILLHGNRVLQTALLRAYVMPANSKVSENERISLSMETVINATLGGLESRRHFDASFIFNRNSDGKARGTAIVGNTARLFPLAGIETVKTNIDLKLGKISDRPRSFPRKLTAKATNELLLYLAYQGRSLYRAIVVDQLDKENTFLKAKRIQIISASPDSFIPIEFLYEGPTPDRDATLCPRAKEALEQGTCQGCNSDPNRKKTHICPVAFWGFSKVIERHIRNRNPDSIDAPRPSEYVLTRKGNIEGRKDLTPLSAAVFGASYKVDEYKDKKSKITQSQKVLTALSQAMPKKVAAVKTWKEWKEKVEELNPSLLVLMPHTLKAFDLPMMEIGAEGEQLHLEEIKEEHLISKNPLPPIVFLMGCETMKAGSADIPFQSLVGPFRQNGAAIVLSTRTKIRSRHSVPVFEKLMESLVEHTKSNKDNSFGDVMLSLRRNALKDGLPMVMCLFAYGDADWQLVEQKTQ